MTREDLEALLALWHGRRFAFGREANEAVNLCIAELRVLAARPEPQAVEPVHGWKGHPHDNGFNWDVNGPEQWHEYGYALGKYHTPAILFHSIEERDRAFALLGLTPTEAPPASDTEEE